MTIEVLKNILKVWRKKKFVKTKNSLNFSCLSRAIANWISEATVQWIKENAGLAAFEIGEFLEDIIAREFNCEIQDGSSDELGSLILELFNFCSSNSDEDNIVERWHF